MTDTRVVAPPETRAPDDPYDARRLRSLDLLRGLAVAGMVIVNGEGNPGAKPPGVSHAAWDGLTPADLVFPTFLLVSGAALGVALRRRPSVHAALVRRAGVLFALGLLLNALPWPGLADLRIMGVLQRIGLSTLLAALVLLHLRTRHAAALAGTVLAGYTALLVVGGPASRAPSTNWPRDVDSVLLGLRHLYSPTRGDPEGLASTPAAVVTVLLGAWAVRVLRDRGVRAAALLGGALLAAGAAVATVVSPNKFLWTPSFTLLCAGAGVLLLAGLSALADSSVRRVVGKPWEALGRNALVVYVGSELTIMVLRSTSLRDALYRAVFEPLGGARGGSLLYALAVLLVWWTVCAVLWRRRTFVTV
ncbi:MAG: heparan-alpha-glucosaminide N-acetyltransferase domain-containing protein [Angustibacter sp.]